MKKREKSGDKKVCEGWRVVVEAVGTPGQRDYALRQAARYVVLRLAGRKNHPPSGNLKC